MIKFGRYYFRGRTFIYRIDALPSEFDKPNVYVYRKPKYKAKKRRAIPRRSVLVLLVFALIVFFFLANLGTEDTNKLISDTQNVTGGFIAEIQKSTGSIVKKCEDGTLEGFCSAKKPLFCENGTLVAKASVCGCPEKYTRIGESCAYTLTLNPETGEFSVKKITISKR